MKVKEKRVVVIDEDGANLGEMDGHIAVKLADSKGLEIVLVHKKTPEQCAVYRIMSKKQIDDRKVTKNQQSKKDPRQVTKEINLSTKIASHDFDVKLSQIRNTLAKLYNVRVLVDTGKAGKRGDNPEELMRVEKEKQLKLIADIENFVAGVGVKVAKANERRNKMQCTFRSIVKDDPKQ